ncbi:MAG: acyloxyacyl hydrolase [Chitinophagaceae bacterium]|nr:acyloxyacyl hydrolase [Chitinophagaceae bacterium]
MLSGLLMDKANSFYIYRMLDSKPSLLWIAFILNCPFLLCAQSNANFNSNVVWKGWGIAPTYSHGRVIRHTPNFQPEIEGPSNAFEINLSKQTHGSKDWQQLYHYPLHGIAIAYTDYGNKEVLGYGISILPNLDIPLIRGERLCLHLRIGTGIAFLSEHYDYNNNPENNVIATTINNTTSFSLGGSWRFARNFSFLAGGSLTHFSSGAVKTPNLGINIKAWNVGLRYEPVPYDKSEFIKRNLAPLHRRVLFNVAAGLGFQEQLPAEGPMYHVYQFQLSAGTLLTRWNKLSIGAMGTYKEAANSFIKHEEIYPDQYFLHSCAVSGFIKDEFLFGFAGVSIVAGYNFYKPSPLEYGFYQKLGVPIYLPPFGKEKHEQFSIGVYVTAGEFTADYVSVDAGFEF